MMADTKLYWDPRSNTLFIQEYETQPVKGEDRADFAVKAFRPCSCCKDLQKYPWFEAVKICSFGTWGILDLAIYARENGTTVASTLISQLRRAAKSDSKKEAFFSRKKNNEDFRMFAKANPEFMKVRFAEEKELVKSVPKTAQIRKPSKRVKP